MTHSPPQSCVCECGCGLSFPLTQMVHRKSANENLYIPHCIDAHGLFCEPRKLRDKLIESAIDTHFYALPGESFTHWLTYDIGMLFTSYVKHEDPVYGIYFVAEGPALKDYTGQYSYISWTPLK